MRGSSRHNLSGSPFSILSARYTSSLKTLQIHPYKREGEAERGKENKRMRRECQVRVSA